MVWLRVSFLPRLKQTSGDLTQSFYSPMAYVMRSTTPGARTLKKVGEDRPHDNCTRLDEVAPTTDGTSHT